MYKKYTSKNSIEFKVYNYKRGEKGNEVLRKLNQLSKFNANCLRIKGLLKVLVISFDLR